MPSRKDPVKSKKVNDLMVELVALEEVGDAKAEKRISKIRKEIIGILQDTVEPDGGEACRNTRSKEFLDGAHVTLEAVGNTEARKKTFGKRVYEGGIPQPLPPEKTPYRFSKRMHIQEKHSSVKSMDNKKDLEDDTKDIFSPRNKNLRSGLLNMETKGTRFPPVQMSPRELLVQRPYYDVTSEMPSKKISSQLPSGVFPPSPRGFEPPQPHHPSKIREVRLHDGYLMEKSPRKLPTPRERIERSYKMGL